MFEHAEPAVAIPDETFVAPVQADLAFALPRPLGRVLEVLTLVGGDPPGRAPATWLEEYRGEFVRLLERRPLEADGARRFLPDEVLVVAPTNCGGVIWGASVQIPVEDHDRGRRVFVYSVRDLARTWDRYLPRTLRRCDRHAADALQLVAISPAGVVDVFDVDRKLAIRRGT